MVVGKKKKTGQKKVGSCNKIVQHLERNSNESQASMSKVKE